jgi:phenylpropionate dioxygenase-like ring-hydroxylating dioxygenase large terminal subunit
MTREFVDFRSVWTPVAIAGELRAGKPLAAQVAGTRIVLWRGPDGAPAALIDRCPHRGAALSLGRVTGGVIQCPFHGWRFDAAGCAVSIPWNPDAKTGVLGATAVPVREAANLIWIYTEPGANPGTAPESGEIDDPRLRLCSFALEWRVHWTRAMENMLDSPHLPFVHRATIGRGLVQSVERRMDIAVEERPWGFRSTISVDGDARPGALDFRWPNRMVLHIGLPRRTLVLSVACVPIDACRTRLLLTTARSFLKHPWLDAWFNLMNRRIAAEDKAIVESSDPIEVPDARAEKSVRTDAPTLRFRTLYQRRLKQGDSWPPPRAA